MVQATSVRLDSRLNELLETYTKSHGISKSEFIKQAVAEQLEDWLDIQEADKAYLQWKEDEFKTYTHEEMLQRLGLD